MSRHLQKVQAAQLVLDRFKDSDLVWGVSDCGKMVDALLTALGIDSRFAAFGNYATEKRALVVLKRRFTDLAAWMDSLALARIAPAAATAGDIIGFEGKGAWPIALTMAVGNGRILGFHELHGGCRVLQPDYRGIDAVAWRT